MGKNMNVLITGGAGFIGSNLALKLVSKGYKVSVLDNLSPQIHGTNPEKTSPLYQTIIGKVNFIKGTVTSRTDWEEALDGQNVIVHLAAETGTGQSMYEIEKYTNVNIVGTALLLDILTNSKHNIKKVVVASSRAIYGEGKYICSNHGTVYPLARNDVDMSKKDFECKCPVCGNNVQLCATDEGSKIHPTSIYGITKQNQEQMVMTTCPTIGIAGISFRYQNVYGPGQSLSNPYTGILSIFSIRLKNNKSINIFEDGKEARDFVYIDDVVNATIKGIESKIDGCIAVNVGTGIPTSVLTVAETLKKLYESRSDITISGNYRIGDIRHNIADITFLKGKLDYKPAVSFYDGIKNFSDWVKKQDTNTIDNSYERSLSELKEKGLYK
jgi:dTDP-L-rhamnose 4-epimerase